jgi:hypothetical protein
MLRKKKNQRAKQIGMIVFLVLIALGFMVPGFIDPTDEESISEPRLCQNDAECYLLCDEVPIASLCSQNMCMQNSCEEKALYEYDLENPLDFFLSIEVNNKAISFLNRTNNNDIFVTFNNNKDGSEVKLFSSGLALRHILDKAGFYINEQCLQVDSINYCNDEDNELKIIVNGETSGAFENFIPKAGDKVKIEYVPVENYNKTLKP